VQATHFVVLAHGPGMELPRVPMVPAQAFLRKMEVQQPPSAPQQNFPSDKQKLGDALHSKIRNLYLDDELARKIVGGLWHHDTEHLQILVDSDRLLKEVAEDARVTLQASVDPIRSGSDLF